MQYQYQYLYFCSGQGFWTCLALAATAACGPSFRLQEMSAGYFEKCNTADVDKLVSLETRKECWNSWLKHYAFDEDPENVQHARARLSTLSGRGSATDSPPAVALQDAGAPADDSTNPCDPLCKQKASTCRDACEKYGEGCEQACDREEELCQNGCL